MNLYIKGRCKKMLKAIIFDLDDTLLWDEKSVSMAFKATCEKAREKYDIDAAQLEENVRKHALALYPTYETYAYTQNIGTGPFEGMWGGYNDEGEDARKMREIMPKYRQAAWFNGLQDLDIEDAELAAELALLFPKERQKHIYLYDETLDVLNQLRGNYKLMLLTNGSSDVQKTKLSLSPELAPYFDHIIISGEFGKGKPSPEIFNYAISLLEVEKRETIMIGDNPLTDILGASKSGIDSIWINHHDKTLTEVIPTFEINRLKEILPIIKSLSE